MALMNTQIRKFLFNKNKSKNSNNPLENNPPINKSYVKYDPLSGGVNPNTENNNQEDKSKRIRQNECC